MIKTILTILVLSFPVFAQINQTFYRKTVLRRTDNGKIVEKYVRLSRFVRDDRGRPIEQVIHTTPKLKGIPDRELEDFVWGRPTQERPGISKWSRDFDHQYFSSSVEVKDVWDAHWPAGSRIKVYFSADFNNDLPVLMEVLNAWNSLIDEVQFAYAGTAESAQLCEGCLTVMRNPNLRDGGTFQYADRNSDGIIVYGRLYLRRLDSNTLSSIFAHELGHSLGLSHQNEGLMKERLPKGRLFRPTQFEADLVRDILNL